MVGFCSGLIGISRPNTSGQSAVVVYEKVKKRVKVRKERKGNEGEEIKERKYTEY